MRESKGRLQVRGSLLALVGATLAAALSTTSMVTAGTVKATVAHAEGDPVGLVAAHQRKPAGRPAVSPLELMVDTPEAGGPPPPGGPGTGPDDDTFWPDSSSPVRNAPSNSTNGPATPSLPTVPGWNLTKATLPDGARQRYYLVARPTIVTTSHLPLLLVLPGRDMTPATIARASDFLRLVGQAIVVFPAGFANSWNAGYCCGVAHLADVNDVAFLEKVVARVVDTQPGTEARQVYIVGFSNGGRMALDMACADPGGFAGVAAVEAVAVSSCLRTVPVPVLEVASTGDPLLTVLAGEPPKHIAGHVETTVQALVEHWRGLDGCSVNADRTDYRAMSLTLWPQCRGSARVAMAVYDGGRHAWPHGGPGTPPAQEVIWEFFHGQTPQPDVTPAA